MKIWIDAYEANVPNRLGSSQVALGLLKTLEHIDNRNEYTLLLPNSPLTDLPKERKGWSYKILYPNRLWTLIALPLALYKAKEKPDLIFSPTHYIPRFSPVKTVATIFDLSFLHFPEMFTKKDLWQLTNWTRYSILNANHIITISNSSKKDIIERYGIDKKKVTVAYPGYNSDIFKLVRNKEKISQVVKKYNLTPNYIIHVGTLQPRKNLIRLIDAFENLEGVSLVIVGKSKGEGREGWMFEEILKRPKELNIESRVIFTGFVSSEELPFLLSGARAFIQPSLWEGFGIGVLEAMACGVPVIVSNVSSLPEVVGKAGLLIDPYSQTQIEQAIRLVVSDSKIHSRLSKLSLKRSKQFSWKKMAKKVLNVLEEIN